MHDAGRAFKKRRGGFDFLKEHKTSAAD
jgi:hypothetical protein